MSAISPKSTGRVISRMLGVEPRDYMALFDRINVCPVAQESTIDPKKYRVYAANLGASVLRHRRVIFLGKNVAACFGQDNPDLLTWHSDPVIALPYYGLIGWDADRRPPFEWAVLPHPSGRNRWYNDEDNLNAATQFLRTELGRYRASICVRTDGGGGGAEGSSTDHGQGVDNRSCSHGDQGVEVSSHRHDER